MKRVKAMAFVGVSQYHHNNQQIDEYEYDDTDNFYDDGVNFGNYLDVDDSEGECYIERLTKRPNKWFLNQNSTQKMRIY